MKHLSFTDLITFLRDMDSETSRCNIKGWKDTSNQHSELTLLSNQFYQVVNFPDFKLEFVSPNIYRVLGYTPDQMTLQRIYNLIHPQDLPLILLASKKLIECLMQNIEHLQPGQMTVTFDYRIKTASGRYIRVLNQSGMISKDEIEQSCQTITLFSDISGFKTSNQIKFDLINYGPPVSFTFPDEELSNIARLFTPREREVLSLLTVGKNSSEIGDQLCISKHTVDTHRRHMLSKSHLCNTAELVAFAINNNWF